MDAEPSGPSRFRVLLAGFPPAFCSPGTGRRRVAWGENPRNRPEKRNGAPAGAVPFPGRCGAAESKKHRPAGAPGGGDARFLGLAPQAICRRPSGTLGGCRAFQIPSPSARVRVLLGFPPASCSPGTGRRRAAWGANPRNRPDKGMEPRQGRCPSLVVAPLDCRPAITPFSRPPPDSIVQPDGRAGRRPAGRPSPARP